jgi:hypothetical protein
LASLAIGASREFVRGGGRCSWWWLLPAFEAIESEDGDGFRNVVMSIKLIEKIGSRYFLNTNTIAFGRYDEFYLILAFALPGAAACA